jgi:hypothetical protein
VTGWGLFVFGYLLGDTSLGVDKCLLTFGALYTVQCTVYSPPETGSFEYVAYRELEVRE